MAATSGTATKYCCKCGSDVTGAKRMRDSAGKYWCLPCGQKDRQTKARAAGAVCGGCGEMFATGKMTELSGALYCEKCLKKGYKKASGGGGGKLSGLLDVKRLFPSGGDDQDAARNKKLLMILGILVLLILVVNFLR